MKRIHIVGLCLMAVFAISAVAASGASAANFLFKSPTGGFPVSFLSHGAEAKLLTVGGQEIKCTSVDNQGEVETHTLGLVLITFLGCTTKVLFVTLKCTNTATEGNIDVHLAFHLGRALPSGNPAVLFLLPGGKFEFECTKAAKIAVTGEVIGLLLETGTTKPLKTNTAYSSIELSFKQSSAGVQEDKIFDLSPGEQEMSGVHLNSSLNGETAEEASEVTSDVLDGFKNSSGTVALELESP